MTVRDRTDLCPGVFRPWPAEDGGLVRLRPTGGLLPSRALVDLVGVAEAYGDGRVHLTSRANVQLRALPLEDGAVPGEVVDAIEATGLLPSRSHELVRNIMVSPQSGFWAGRVDLRPLADELDRLLCADPRLAGLPGRFLFVLDDGRGDLLDRTLDLGVVGVSPAAVQLRLGSEHWGAMVPVARAAAELVALAHVFLDARGEGPEAPWHVDELGAPLEPPCERYWGIGAEQPPLPDGEVPGGVHHVVADGAVDRALAETVAAAKDVVVVTPWRGLFVPDRVRQ
ncbi:nitrite reductase [Nocardioides anomalus]|nr:nitrite reductase [Nocardioides anomalus]